MKKSRVITEDQGNAILGYLATRPYQEVFELINIMQQTFTYEEVEGMLSAQDKVAKTKKDVVKEEPELLAPEEIIEEA